MNGVAAMETQPPVKGRKLQVAPAAANTSAAATSPNVRQAPRVPLIPTSTYRLQLRQGVDLREARVMVPLLDSLGAGALYLSPVFQARSGSTHGYDVTDPTVVDPEVGSMVDFLDLAGALREHGMGLLLDIVPNHMAAGLENPYWVDLLEQGTASPYALWFAIDWSAGRLVLPVLPKPLSRCKPRVLLAPSGFKLEAAGSPWPLSLASCRPFVARAARTTPQPERQMLLAAFRPRTPLPVAKDLLWRAYQGQAKDSLDKAMAAVQLKASSNGRPTV